MSTSRSHFSTVYNNLCFKVPVNPCSSLPSPSYERSDSKIFSVTDPKDSAMPEKRYNSLNTYRTNNLMNSKNVTPDNQTPTTPTNINDNVLKDSIDSFREFYSSIPDYNDVTHLSDREFALKLHVLREKQKSYLNLLNDGNIEEPASSKCEKYKQPHDTSMPNSSVTKFRDMLNKPKWPKDNCITGTSVQFSTVNKHVAKPTAHSNYDPYKYCPRPSSSSYSVASCKSSRNAAEFSTGESSRTSDSESVVGYNKYKNLPPGTKSKTHSREHKENVSKSWNLFDVKDREQKSKTNRLRDNVLNGDNSNNPESSFQFTDNPYYNGEYIPKADYTLSDSESDSLDSILLSRSFPVSPKRYKNIVWKQPKITVPRPFKMTLRDEEDRYFNELRTEALNNYKHEDSGAKTVFKANPVPAHARLRLFEKMMAEQEKRRQKVRKQSMEELKSQMRPFSFVKRDEARRRLQLSHSSPELRDCARCFRPFKAKPVPKNLFSNYAYQKTREDEFYRSLKKKIRAEELLKSSTLPPSMAARERLEKARTRLEAEEERKPKRKSYSIPNYRRSHEKLRKDLEERIGENVTTVPKPFCLKTAELSGRRSSRSASPVVSSRLSPYEIPLHSHDRSRSASAMELTGNRNNLAAILRIQSVRDRQARELAQKTEEQIQKEEAKIRAKVMRRKPAWKALDYSLSQDLALRMQHRREVEQLHQEKFEVAMDRMMDRVYQIPTLFERQTQFGLKQKIKKKCKEALKRKGLAGDLVIQDITNEDDAKREHRTSGHLRFALCDNENFYQANGNNNADSGSSEDGNTEIREAKNDLDVHGEDKEDAEEEEEKCNEDSESELSDEEENKENEQREEEEIEEICSDERDEDESGDESDN